jgi:hypothetical protein
MTPELEVLDQLQGGDLPLEVVAKRFDDHSRFLNALVRMVEAGEVALIDPAGNAVPHWHFQEIARGDTRNAAVGSIRVSLTDIGARRIA